MAGNDVETLPDLFTTILFPTEEGKVAITTLGKTRMLEAGHLMYLPAGEPYALDGIEDSSLLLTTVVPKP
jgi:glyoxylate utilization-related uncharacterized protein